MPQRCRACQSTFSDQGFALPLAVGMGLIMILVGMTLISRSQVDQVTASAQKNTAQGLAIAEAGIARTLAALQQQRNADLLIHSQDPVPAGEQPLLGEAVDEWQQLQTICPLPPNLEHQGEIEGAAGGSYQVKAYRYDAGPDRQPQTEDDRGTLLVEGQARSARSLVQVEIPITQRQVFPGLYASHEVNLGNNDVLRAAVASPEASNNANILCRDCARSAEFCGSDGPLPKRRNAVGAGPQSQIEGEIILLQPQLPTVPTFPTGAASAFDLTGGLLNTGAAEPLVILPRAADLVGHTLGSPLHYRLSDLDLGNRPLVINSSWGPVYLYVSGHVRFSGGVGMILHIQNPDLKTLNPQTIDLKSLEKQLAGRPENFRIYGNPPDPEDRVRDQEFTLNGGAIATNLFVYAPDAQMGVNGGSQDPDFQGALWVKAWDGSSSNQVQIRVPDDLPKKLGPEFNQAGQWVNGTGSILSWQRRGVSDQR